MAKIVVSDARRFPPGTEVELHEKTSDEFRAQDKPRTARVDKHTVAVFGDLAPGRHYWVSAVDERRGRRSYTAVASDTAEAPKPDTSKTRKSDEGGEVLISHRSYPSGESVVPVNEEEGTAIFPSPDQVRKTGRQDIGKYDADADSEAAAIEADSDRIEIGKPGRAKSPGEEKREGAVPKPVRAQVRGPAGPQPSASPKREERHEPQRTVRNENEPRTVRSGQDVSS